ncbi:MAG: putative toxin-antitoxin system toxin component, PIN family, partial [Acidobacteriota bacterium]|nr:putative toxin-antitoxin system toxin component, PIN family [Acidobacteriota bacterium]
FIRRPRSSFIPVVRLWQTRVRMRVVLDTNVLISACLKPQGLEAQVVRMVLSGSASLFVTEAILEEYRDVFSRPKFAHFPAQLLADLERLAGEVTPHEAVTAATDEDDNRFLECAQAAAADFLITGNLRHYPAEWAGTRIVNARRFLGAVGCIIEV